MAKNSAPKSKTPAKKAPAKKKTGLPPVKGGFVKGKKGQLPPWLQK
jgi:hypothetical protein